MHEAVGKMGSYGRILRLSDADADLKPILR